MAAFWKLEFRDEVVIVFFFIFKICFLPVCMHLENYSTQTHTNPFLFSFNSEVG